MPEIAQEQLDTFVATLAESGWGPDEIRDAVKAQGLTVRVERGPSLGDETPPPPKRVEPVAPQAGVNEPSAKGFLNTLRIIPDALAVGGQEMVAGAGEFLEGFGSSLRRDQTVLNPLRPAAGAIASLGKTIREPAERSASKIRSESPVLREEFFSSLAKDPIETLVGHGLTQVPQVLAVMASGGAGALRYAPAFVLEAGAARRKARLAGASEDEQNQAAGVTGLANMFLEVRGVDSILSAIKGPKEGVRKFFVDLGKSMLGEGGTEGVQEFVGNLSALAVYAGERGFGLDDLKALFSPRSLREYGAAGIIGAVTSGGVTTVGRALSPGSVPAPEKADAPPPQPQPDDSPIQTEERVIPAAPVVPAPSEARVVGRPDLANPATGTMERDLVTAVQQEREQLHPTVRRYDEEVRAEAAERLEQNGIDAERDRFLAFGVRSDSDVAVAKALVQEFSSRALASGKTEDLVAARAVVDRYYSEGTEQARALRFRRDFTMPPSERQKQALRDSLLMPSERLREELEAAKDEGEKALALAEEKYAREINEARRLVFEAGIDLDALLSHEGPFSTDQKRDLVDATRISHEAKAGVGEKLIEYWRNAILSAPTTHAANLLGNTTFLLWDQAVQRPVEAILSKVPGLDNPGSPIFKEIGTGLRAAFDKGAWSRALRNGLSAFKTERPIFSEQFGDSTAIRAEPITRTPRTAIKGRLGKAVRIPQRLLLASDEIAKTVIYEMQIQGIAQRHADRMRVPFEEMAQNPTPDMIEEAYDKTLELVFQKPLGRIGQTVLGARRRHPVVGTFVLPFVVTPANIAKISLRKSPLGIFNVLSKYQRHMSARLQNDPRKSRRYEKPEQVRDLAEQVVSWGVMSALFSMMGDEDDEPRITGSKSVKAGEREFQYRAEPPQSIRIGDQWFSYSRIEPLSVPLTMAVDLAGSLRRSVEGQTDIEEEWPKFWSSFTSIVRDKTFLRGISDILEMVEQGAQGRIDGTVEFASNWVTSWVPNAVKSAGRATSPFLRETRPRGGKSGSAEWLRDAAHASAEEAFPFGDSWPVRHDLWGNPIRTSDPTGRPATDFGYRLLSPLRSQRANVSEVDRLIRNYNNEADDPWHPVLPRPYFQRRGETSYMTRQEYQEWLSRSGQMAHENLLLDIRQGILDPDSPSERDIKIIDKRIRSARDIVKGQMGLGR